MRKAMNNSSGNFSEMINRANSESDLPLDLKYMYVAIISARMFRSTLFMIESASFTKLGDKSSLSISRRSEVLLLDKSIAPYF